MTVWARPRTSQPPKGVLRLLERNRAGSIVQRVVGVDDRDVGVGAGAERPLGNPQQLRRVDRELADHLGPGQVARLDQARDGDRDQGLQADDAERGLVDLAHLLLAGVRGVVGGEDLDRAVLEAADDRLDVAPGPQRRVHLEVGVERRGAARR